jgi:hypothetical protein
MWLRSGYVSCVAARQPPGLGRAELMRAPWLRLFTTPARPAFRPPAYAPASLPAPAPAQSPPSEPSRIRDCLSGTSLHLEDCRASLAL